MARTTDNASASATSANSSITNVAALANVSIATVSRVLSGKRTKDDDIARRVRAAAAHLNYSVNYAASALRSTVTNTIGLVIPTANDPFCLKKCMKLMMAWKLFLSLRHNAPKLY